jgi:hypothetical protein
MATKKLSRLKITPQMRAFIRDPRKCFLKNSKPSDLWERLSAKLAEQAASGELDRLSAHEIRFFVT